MVDPFALHVFNHCERLSLVSSFVARYHLAALPPTLSHSCLKVSVFFFQLTLSFCHGNLLLDLILEQHLCVCYTMSLLTLSLYTNDAGSTLGTYHAARTFCK